MAHHAYFATGERAAAVNAAQDFAEQELGEQASSLDVIHLSFELFSVDDARRLISAASVSGIGGQKAVIVSMTRVFHEAQNALLKILEEPPAGTVIILCVPSEGVFLPTLRSRLLPLPGATTNREHGSSEETAAAAFLAASPAERAKIAAKLIEQSKSDKEETKQRARREAIELAQGITEAAHARLRTARSPAGKKDARLLLEDLTAFMPILYERSAPLKLIFEHLLMVLPADLRTARV